MQTFAATVAALILVAFGARADESPLATLPARVPVDIELNTLTGTPRTEVVTIVVSLYAHKADADPLWSEEQTVKANAEGKLTVLAGATTDNGIPPQLFSASAARWIGIAVKGEPEQPRIMMVSVPYAVRARDAERIDGRPAADFVRRDELKENIRQVLAEPLATMPRQWSGHPSPNVATAVAAPPRANIVLPTPAASFQQIAASGLTTGAEGIATSTDDGVDAMTGVNGLLGKIPEASPGAYSAGVRGINMSTTNKGMGVGGFHNGGGWGVYGSSVSGPGVFGASGMTGVYGTGQYGVIGYGVTGVYASTFGGGAALEINDGALKVSGTTKTAFSFTTATDDSAVIDNALCNGDPNALIFVLPVSPFDGYSIPLRKPVFVSYLAAYSNKWQIFNSDGSTLPAGTTFNVLIIKQ